MNFQSLFHKNKREEKHKSLKRISSSVSIDMHCSLMQIRYTFVYTHCYSWLYDACIQARSADREQTDREPMVSSQWFGLWFRQRDLVTKWGFWQDGSGDSKMCLWSLFSATPHHLVCGQLLWTRVHRAVSVQCLFAVCACNWVSNALSMTFICK